MPARAMLLPTSGGVLFPNVGQRRRLRRTHGLRRAPPSLSIGTPPPPSHRGQRRELCGATGGAGRPGAAKHAQGVRGQVLPVDSGSSAEPDRAGHGLQRREGALRVARLASDLVESSSPAAGQAAAELRVTRLGSDPAESSPAAGRAAVELRVALATPVPRTHRCAHPMLHRPISPWPPPSDASIPWPDASSCRTLRRRRRRFWRWSHGDQGAMRRMGK